MVQDFAEAKLKTLGYRWHDLRHTCVSRLVEQGADVALVQAVAGHASAATTLRIYTHLRDQRVREASFRFDPGTNRAPTLPGARTGDGESD
jgi:integrase